MLVEEEELVSVPDAETVLSDTPVTVEETPRAPEPLLVRSVVATTILD